ncbi:hypothetical protein ElyMa_000352400 [Elysia marginata]|uniref:Uncharacterized protein n=1 Tax=Elysia marginata TaxID=1093978 RepID=A0AAV4FDP4_9GAST|nr:hypothetical protein ElyMa_000352400 [Elysia marginata]
MVNAESRFVTEYDTSPLYVPAPIAYVDVGDAGSGWGRCMGDEHVGQSKSSNGVAIVLDKKHNQLRNSSNTMNDRVVTVALDTKRVGLNRRQVYAPSSCYSGHQTWRSES